MFNRSSHVELLFIKKFDISAAASSALEKVALLLVIIGLLVPAFVK